MVTGNEDSCVLQNARKGLFRYIPTVPEEDKILNTKEKTSVPVVMISLLVCSKKSKAEWVSKCQEQYFII